MSVTAMGRFATLVRRELWEHGAVRAVPFWIAILLVGVLGLAIIATEVTNGRVLSITLHVAKGEAEDTLNWQFPADDDAGGEGDSAGSRGEPLDPAESEAIAARLAALEFALAQRFQGVTPPQFEVTELADRYSVRISRLTVEQAIFLFRALEPAEVQILVNLVFLGLGALFNVVLVLTVLLYALDALYGERRDRTALFWKSTPVPDGEVVASKAFVALLAAPVLMLLAVGFTEFAVLGVWSLALWMTGAAPYATLWAHLHLLPALSELGAMLAFQTLWLTPIVGWLLLVSAAANKMPLFWAALTPLGIIFVERAILGSGRFNLLVGERLNGLARGFEMIADGDPVERLGPNADPSAPWATFAGLVDHPSVWGGVIVGLVLMAMAAYIRRLRSVY